MAAPRTDLPDPLETARSGALYLSTLVSPSGRFRYRFDHATWRDPGGYNALRHCGTIWAMCDVARHLSLPFDALKAIDRAIGYLHSEFLRRHGPENRLKVVEDTSIKLGGNGLAVLALLGAAKVLERPALVDTATELGRAILDDQMDDGDYVHKTRYPSGQETGYRSEYYTGEAMFALVELHAETGDPAFLESVIRAEALLGPQDYGVPEQSHWMLYALEALSRFRDEDSDYDHAEKIVLDILNHPAYRTNWRSTPAACRSEGMLAFLKMMKRRPADVELRDRVLTAIGENLEAQLTRRKDDGAFVRGGPAGDRREDEVRIDYVQHNISSFLHYGLL